MLIYSIRSFNSGRRFVVSGPANLRVPLCFQPKGKPYCGAAAAKMVFAYHDGRSVSIGRLVREIGVREKRGVRMQAIGRWFLAHGFNATIVAWWKGLPASFLRLKGDALRREQLRWCKRKRTAQRREMRLFLEAGGKFEPRPVTIGDIENTLKRREPPILNMDVLRLYKRNGRRGGHYVVPVSVKKSSIVVNDSNATHGGRKEYSFMDILHACYSHSAGALFISLHHVKNNPE